MHIDIEHKTWDMIPCYVAFTSNTAVKKRLASPLFVAFLVTKPRWRPTPFCHTSLDTTMTMMKMLLWSLNEPRKYAKLHDSEWCRNNASTLAGKTYNAVMPTPTLTTKYGFGHPSTIEHWARSSSAVTSVPTRCCDRPVMWTLHGGAGRWMVANFDMFVRYCIGLMRCW